MNIACWPLFVLVGACALLPGVFYWALAKAYSVVLSNKRDYIKSIMKRGETSFRYLQAFGTTEPQEAASGPKTISSQDSSGSIGTDQASSSSKELHKQNNRLDNLLDQVFYGRFGKKQYRLPVAMNGVVSGCFFAIALMISLVGSGLDLCLPEALQKALKSVPHESIAAVGGALLLGLYDLVRKYDAVDMSPAALNAVWVRMLVVSAIAPLVAGLFSDPAKLFLSFAIGVFPVQSILALVTSQAKKRLGYSPATAVVEAPNLHKLQGVSEDVLARLADQGLERAMHLATADPIKMLMTTNLEWKAILDLIDQAILFGYLGDKLTLLRPIGIRGAIELATLQELLTDKRHPQIQERARGLLAEISSALEIREPFLANMIENLYEDIQVSLIWDLWGDTDAEELDAKKKVSGSSGAADKEKTRKS